MPEAEICAVEGCSEPAVRSLSPKRLGGTSLSLKGGSRKATLCRNHYRQFKKETKEDRRLEMDRYRR